MNAIIFVLWVGAILGIGLMLLNAVISIVIMAGAAIFYTYQWAVNKMKGKS